MTLSAPSTMATSLSWSFDTDDHSILFSVLDDRFSIDSNTISCIYYITHTLYFCTLNHVNLTFELSIPSPKKYGASTGANTVNVLDLRTNTVPSLKSTVRRLKTVISDVFI